MQNATRPIPLNSQLATQRSHTPEEAPELVAYLATHPGPLVAADAIVRTADGRMLILNPPYKEGWDLAGGMNDDEDPEEGLLRELSEELGVKGVPLGRLLAVDTTPAPVYGRPLITFIYQLTLPETVQTTRDLTLQADEIAGADFVADQEALTRFPERLRRRVKAALAAEAGSYIAQLRDGHLVSGGGPRPA
ncbi:NUDIX domain-containing protein [Streptomyces sp. NPDC059970]|uniref:NUDIX domain-containing protein n=1 Tax=Streptomyces sp. NPDC059970 TaxID=3347019 RepID=UPI0036AB2513